MKVVRTIKQMQEISGSLKKRGKTIGFVPTMGALHRGHLSLIARARKQNDVVVVSIFVNPAQFGRGEDYLRYPRVFADDKAACAKNGVDILFVPHSKQMYPDGYLSYVNVEEMSEELCGASRPGHFRGVATVVAKLFNTVEPNSAYFGRKDYQQLKIIQRLAQDLNFNVKIVACPTVREASGLALSSRNRYLSEEEKERCAVIYGALCGAKKLVTKGIAAPRVTRYIRRRILEAISNARFDYVEVADAKTLRPVQCITSAVVIALAVRVSGTRLIDNMAVNI